MQLSLVLFSPQNVSFIQLRQRAYLSRLLLTQALHVAIAGAGKSVTGQAVEEGYESLKAGGGETLIQPATHFLKSGTVQFCRSQLPLTRRCKHQPLMERPAHWLRPPATSTHHSGEGGDGRERVDGGVEGGDNFYGHWQ